MSVALVGPHASMPDDVRLSSRVFCVSELVSCGLCLWCVDRLRSTVRSCAIGACCLVSAASGVPKVRSMYRCTP
eukprot:4796533-Prymnesium_polylepis.2